jgi:6-phosphogluconolactonase
VSAPTIRKFGDLDALSRAAAEEFASLARDAIAARGVFHVALSGGSTPKRLFQLLAAQGKAALPWDQIDLWWGDERAVPPDHKDSNYGMTRDALIAPLSLTRVHRIRGEDAPETAATEYEKELVEKLGAPPVLDLALQGMGPDGHTASLFPGFAQVHGGGTCVAVHGSPKPPPERVTFTLDVINAARRIVLVVTGAEKAPMLAQVLEGPDPELPASLLARDRLEVIADEAALGG